MPHPVPLKGIIAYSITPFTAEGAVDLPKYGELLQRLLDAGVHGIAPLGSTGMLPYLSDPERESIIDATMDRVKGRIPVLAGVSALTTERAIHHARFAERCGVAALMIIPMSYWKLTEDEIFRHFQSIADATPLPIMVYNNPATGGLDMRPEFLARLLEIPHVTMIKESTGDVRRLHRLIELVGPDLAFFNGFNPLALEAFRIGAKGWCTAAPNLIPRLVLDLWAAVNEKHWDKATAVFHQQLPLLEALVQGGLPRTVVAGLKALGVEVGPLRAPLQPLHVHDQEKLASLLRSVSR